MASSVLGEERRESHDLSLAIERRVDELIIRSLQGTASEEEECDLREWRRASLDHERRYREMRRLWSLTETVSSSDEVLPVPSAADLLAGHPTPKRVRPSRRWLPWIVAAAAFAGLLFGFGRVVGPGGEELAYGATEFVTGASEMVTTSLSDGTVIRLGPDSRLRVRGMRHRREVWLDGRAFFAVAKDESRPFTVRTRAGEAVVLGTRFEVLVDDDDFRLLVVEGKVAVESSGQQVQVTAGELTRVVSGAPPAVEKVEDVRTMLDWMGSFLVFESTPLRVAAREIEELYGMRVSIPDSTLAEQTITAWFSNQSPEDVLLVICRIVNAHCSVRDSVASIEP